MSTSREAVAVAVLTALALVLRLWELDSLPAGLHVDEAFNLLDAQKVVDGWRPVFLPDNAGREVLFTYLQAPVVAALGMTAQSARLVSALAGAAAVPATFFLAMSLGLGRRPRLIAVLSAAVMAVSFWGLHFSRFGIRAILFVPVVAFALGLWSRATAAGRGASLSTLDRASTNADRGSRASAVRPGGARLAVLAGLVFGLAFYTHPAGRGLLLVPILHLASTSWQRRSAPSPRAAVIDGAAWRQLAITSAVALVVALPLLTFWAVHPQLFIGHAEEVSVLHAGPRAVGANLLKVAGMFNVAGDPAPWRNLTGPGLTGTFIPGLELPRPVFDPVTGVLFLLGLGLVALQARAAETPKAPGAPRAPGAPKASGALVAPGAPRAPGALVAPGAPRLVLVALAVLLLPSVLTDAAPNYSRTIGALPLICLLPALAADRLAAASPSRRLAVAGLAGWLALATWWTVTDYVEAYAPTTLTALAFDADKVGVANLLDLPPPKFLSPFMAGHPTVRVLADDPRGFDAAQGLVLPDGEVEYVFLDWEEPAISALQAWFAGGNDDSSGLSARSLPSAPGQSDTDLGPRIVLLKPTGTQRPLNAIRPIGAQRQSDRIPTAGTLVSPDTVPTGDPNRAGPLFGGVLELIGADAPATVEPGSTVTVTLAWRRTTAVDLPAADHLTTFVHARDADGNTIAFGDAPPIGGSYPVSAWRETETVLSRHMLHMPPDAAGQIELHVGWYDPETGERLPAEGGIDPTTALAGIFTVDR